MDIFSVNGVLQPGIIRLQWIIGQASGKAFKKYVRAFNLVYNGSGLKLNGIIIFFYVISFLIGVSLPLHAPAGNLVGTRSLEFGQFFESLQLSWSISILIVAVSATLEHIKQTGSNQPSG